MSQAVGVTVLVAGIFLYVVLHICAELDRLRQDAVLNAHPEEPECPPPSLRLRPYRTR